MRCDALFLVGGWVGGWVGGALRFGFVSCFFLRASSSSSSSFPYPTNQQRPIHPKSQTPPTSFFSLYMKTRLEVLSAWPSLFTGLRQILWVLLLWEEEENKNTRRH